MLRNQSIHTRSGRPAPDEKRTEEKEPGTQTARGLRCYWPRTAMDEFENAITFDNLYEGLQKAKRSVMWKDSVAGYSLDGLKNTVALRESIRRGDYEISPYQRFTIYEPKIREIVATRIRDRQFQRSLCDNILYKDMTRGFIFDNCACQRGKGVDFALNRMEEHLRRYFRETGSADGWVLKCDIRHYFPETPHDVAKAAVRKRVKDDRAYQAAADIIDSFGGEKGIGLGSQVSQLIELAVLDDLDHFIKERLRIKHYIRYMDDFILICKDRATLENALREIRARVEALGLELNEKTQIAPLRHGVRFLKWRFILTDTGKVIRRMSSRSITKERRKLKKIAEKVKAGAMPREYMWESFQSWRANAERGNTHFAVRNMAKLYRKLEEEIEHGRNQNTRGDQDGPRNGQGGGSGGTVREAGGAAGAEAGAD